MSRRTALAHGAGPIVALVGAALLQDRHDQIDEVLEALRCRGAAEVEAIDIGSSTQDVRSSATSSAEPTTAGLRLPSPIPLLIRRKVHGSALSVRRGELAAAGPTCYKISDWCCGLRCFAAINTIPSVAPRVLVIAGNRGAAAERVWTASASMG